MNDEKSDSSIFDEEKRRFKRFPVNVEVKFRSLQVDDAPKASVAGKILEGKAKNVSSAGLFIVSASAVEVGQLLEVSFALPDNRVVQILGKVAWISKDASDPGFGVEMYKTDQYEFDEIVRRAKRGQWILAVSEEDEKKS